MQAQEGLTVPLKSVSIDYEKGVYLKDFDHVLEPYVGTWEGILNNKKYTFVLQKFIKQRIGELTNSFYCYEDRVMAKFRVIDLSNNETIYSSLNALTYDEFPASGYSPHINGYMEFRFTDANANCYNTLSFALKRNLSNPNELLYFEFNYEEDWKLPGVPCPFTNRADIPVYLPQENLVLTKL